MVGPSGSGKDSLIGYAKSYLSRSDGIVFARRYITRPPDGRNEQHIPLNKTEFLKRAERGDYLMCWQAHGLSYAIDKSVLSDLRAGFDVVVNGSRAYLPEAQALVPNLVPVIVSASEENLLERLVARSGEDEFEIADRIKRGQKYPCCDIEGALCLHNDGTLATVGKEFCQLLSRQHAAVG